ncbi:heparinase II/III-family protein [Pseudomonas sp.]|uniref:heparinase II/III family protein n=1 Tax=Pseudomonas sp. TaxID=306 RepID=UPI0027374C58|nr:heparinase II/III-family protein [Pseudomonas sp.]MDP3816907.1 heparinase II/III-family protein [Pseudomonas sp.]
MTMLKVRASTALALGLPNLARAISYRLGVRIGLNVVRRLRADVPPAPFFQPVTVTALALPPLLNWQQTARLFSYWPYAVGTAAPDWHSSPLTGGRVELPEADWWHIPDFDPAVGDIKLIWEASRFDWVLAFAQHTRAGETASLECLNVWLSDWCAQNPPYKGANWKCGQEASIRVMHLAMAALILGQAEASASGLLELVRLHLQRIAPTISYAMAQDNNHGTSEAAALFIGGSWLLSQGMAEGERWQRLGRKWLENRAARLIGADGSFSQYSLNYHRVMLDTFCMVEVWRRYLDLPRFSARWYARSLAAVQWQHAMVNAETGDGPNLGANDGARLLQLTDTDYRDFRPSVQLAMALFANARAYAEEGTWNLPLSWLGLDLPKAVADQPASRLFDDGGFAVLRRGTAMVMLRYPRFRFRPSQADALHVDLWLGGRNLLRDAGTFSYNTDPLWLEYFPGTASHNTVQFDDRDQMPRLSRFLFGDWLKTSYIESLHEQDGAATFAAGYRDGQKACHNRHVRLSANALQVVDQIEGFKHKAVLRWRLEPGQWRIEGNSLSNGEHVLEVRTSMPIVRYELLQGWESRYYLEKKQVPVLEIEVRQPGSLTTEYRWVS